MPLSFFYQRMEKMKMNYYVYNRPSGAVSYENPPRFTWMPAEDGEIYTIEVFNSQHEPCYRFDSVPINFYTPDMVMEPGDYTYRILSGEKTLVSEQPFSISKNAAITPLKGREHRYDAISAHPRIWLNQPDITRLKERSQTELQPYWNRFLETGVRPWVGTSPHNEPLPYPNNKRVIPIWRKMYMDCQEALYAVKHCAVAWRVTGAPDCLATAKNWLMTIASWDTAGPTARSYNDEAAFRIITALAWGYDWLYEDLTSEERRLVKSTLLTRARELYDYVKNQIKIHIKLLDSHGVRSLSMALVPAALALYEEEAEAVEWLNYTIEYFFTMFSPWGGDDGGWAEGPTYWQSGVSFFTEAISLIKKATGLDIFKRPFFKNTGDFILNTYCQDTRFMAFGDMSDLGDYPGLKAGYTMRILSATSDSPNRRQYAWYYEQAKKRGEGTEHLFYNYGWWNFDFDELFFHMLYTPTPIEVPDNRTTVKWFRDIGWVCIHKNMADEKRHLAFYFKSSPYGSVSHSHGDQNAFVLHGFGEPLAIQSGYYIGYWSSMHTEWRRHTKSKNAILIGDKGQFAQLHQKTKAEEMNGSAKSQFESLMAANGTIEECSTSEGSIYIRGDALNAYRKTVPALLSAKRHVLMIEETFFLIIDEIELSQEETVSWLMHGLHEFTLGNNSFSSSHQGTGVDVLFTGSSMVLEQTNQFEGVNPNETEGLNMQWHIKATTEKPQLSHRIASLLYPYREEDKEFFALNSAEGDELIITRTKQSSASAGNAAGKEYHVRKKVDSWQILAQTE